jgi:hypothetical protein
VYEIVGATDVVALAGVPPVNVHAYEEIVPPPAINDADGVTE